MRYLYLLVISLFFVACKHQLPVLGTPARYQESLPIVRPQTISMDFSMRYDSLYSYLQLAPGKVLFDSKNQSGMDFPLRLMLLQKPQILVGNKGNIGLQLPVNVEARPNIAGINTGLIQAKTKLFIDFDWNWQDINHHRIESLRLNYEWMAKPEMRVLGFPVQVHGIVDPLIQRQLPEMQARALNRLNQAVKPNAIADLLNQVNMQYASPIGLMTLQSADVDLHDVRFNTEGLVGKLLVRTALHVGDSLGNQPNRWLEMNSQSQALPFQVMLSFDKLNTLLVQSLHLKENQLQLHGDSNGLHAQLSGYGSRRAKTKLIVVPMLHDSSHIGLSLQALSLEGVPFFMRGHFKRKVTRFLGSYIWSANEVPSLLNQNTWGLGLQHGQVILRQLTFSQKGIGITGEIAGNWELRK